MSVRSSIIAALDTRFKSISVANGYHTSLGAAVYHWRTDNIPENTCPVLVYRDLSDDEQFNTTKIIEHTIPLEIELLYAVDDIADVYTGIEDVMTAMSTDDTLNGLLESSTPKANSMDVNGQGQRIIVTAKINIDLKYRTTKWEL